MTTNNKLLNIRGIGDGMQGKNYIFDDIMAFLMERLGRPELDYWLFTGVTGDGVAMVYNRKPTTHCEYCVSGFLAGSRYVRSVFEAVGYGCDYITAAQVNMDKAAWLKKLMESIDKGIPVVVKTALSDMPAFPNDVGTYFLCVGYEDGGNALLFVSNSEGSLYKYHAAGKIRQDWIFVGEKVKEFTADEIVRAAAVNMTHWLSFPEKDGVFFGAQAFRAWADDIGSGRYDNESDMWGNYGVFFCNLATNSWANNISDAPHASLLYKLAKLNPEYSDVRDKVAEQYFRIGNGDGKGGIWNELEGLGGGFNANHETLHDNRAQIAAKLREAAECTDEIVRVLTEKMEG
ncbi:MAG: hypothetical protein LBK46_00090 [Oscillospiraceae bacterium]|jgi:hypothetical protein|nr:hypothetical protein [Oscillospiraceae bacterium]